jgi:hypothetical protein
VQRGTDADRGILLPGDVGEAPHRVRVAQRREPERLGPLREGAGGEGDPDVLDERVPRVGRHGHGYAVWRALGERLQGVAPPGRHARVVERVDVEVVEVLLEHDDASRRLADGTRLLEHRSVRAGLDDGLEHQADLLLEGEPTEQVLDAVRHGQPRVLVGVHPAVAVEVAVGDAVLGGGELGAHGVVPFVVRDPVAVRCGRSGGHGVRRGEVRRPGWRRTSRSR